MYNTYLRHSGKHGDYDNIINQADICLNVTAGNFVDAVDTYNYIFMTYNE